MTLLEGTILFILLLLSLPGLCRRIGRPGLLYPSYIIAGGLAGLLMPDHVSDAWRQFGQLGFILLLFSVGLEIELPQRRDSVVAARRALAWMAPQVLPIIGVLVLAGTPPLQAAVAAVALSSTSVGMAFVLWSGYPFASAEQGRAFLSWMLAIEVLTILFLASMGPALSGVVWWLALLQFVGLLLAATMAAWVALRWVPHFASKMSSGLKLDTPLLVLCLFGICAIGDRLGLSAPKTAFVLGLFISRSTDEEVALNHRLAPIRDRLFVPVFFFGLGTLLTWEAVGSWQFLAAAAAGVVLFVLRRVLYGSFFAKLFSTDARAHGMAAPVLTLAAVAVEMLVHAGATIQLVSWILAAGLSLTLCAALGFRVASHSLAEMEPSMAAPEAAASLGGKHAAVDSSTTGEGRRHH